MFQVGHLSPLSILLSASACHPLRLPGVAVADCVEGEFDATGNPQLVEDVEHVLFHSVFAKAELARNLAIAEPICNQGHDLLLARGKQSSSVSVNHPQTRYLGYGLDQILQLLTIGPHLSLMNALDALAQQAKWVIVKAE
jgi:hypothetical protein